jgi:3-phenylpropionate/trans-cinnamate dioxygenase ferredoxin reductase subunit
MGRAAGRAMAGDLTPYTHLPFFYSDLFDRGYEAVGELDPRGQTVLDWKQEFLEGVVYYLADGRVRGVLLWNTWGQVDAARTLIAEPGPFEAGDLMGRLGT